MTTLDTVFASNDGALTASNLLKPATGEIELLERSSTNFTSTATLAEVIATDEIYDLGTYGAQVPVLNNGVVHTNLAAVITKTPNFSVVTLTTAAGKTIVVTDADANFQTVTLAASAGTIEVTSVGTGVVTNNSSALVTVTGALTGTITYTYTAAAEGTATLTFTSTDGVIAATPVTTTVTVTAA